jgi:hypothetical protein
MNKFLPACRELLPVYVGIVREAYDHAGIQIPQ